jgi:predicted dehydrogenase
MNHPLRLGLIGVGGFGEYHLKVIETLTAEGLCRLVAVADPAIGASADLQAKFESDQIRWHVDYRALLEEEIDAVLIVTPIQFHFEMARACIERGLFVMLEKPPVPLIQQVEELIRLDEAGRVCVNFQWVGSNCVQRLKKLVVDGTLGAIRDIRVSGCWPRGDGYYSRAPWAGRLTVDGSAAFDGPATNALAHQIHNIMYLAGPTAQAFAVPVEVEGELYRARAIESYDVAGIRGRFGSGARFAVAVAHPCADELPFKIEVRGEHGSARIVEDGARFENNGDSIDCLENALELLEKSYRQFLGFVAGDRPRVDTRLCDARGYVASTNAMLLSSGGIHTIGRRWQEPCRIGDDRGINVKGLAKLGEAVFETGLPFAALGAPWAIRSTPVAIRDLTRLDLAAPPQEFVKLPAVLSSSK